MIVLYEGKTMPRRYSYSPTNPFILWTTLAMKTWEMMFASAQVIGHRTGRIALAGPAPNARDQREFHLMGQEKIEAAAESIQAVALRMFSMNQQVGLIMFRQMASMWGSLISLAGSRTLPQMLKAYNDIMNNMMSRTASSMTQLGDSVARTMHKGLTPIHSRATANAKRLARTKLMK
jgi:hypothetical protein